MAAAGRMINCGRLLCSQSHLTVPFSGRFFLHFGEKNTRDLLLNGAQAAHFPDVPLANQLYLKTLLIIAQKHKQRKTCMY